MNIKRLLDIVLALVSLPVIVPLIALVSVAVKLTSPGPLFYTADRVGRNREIFRMPKFRTMSVDTPEVATHMLQNPERYLTSIGSLLRRSSLDELPQIVNILAGEMSWVGPRPALFNQDDLVALREEKGINKLVPGLTGWAQINGRDDLDIPSKVELDEYYLMRRSVLLDMKIILMTIGSVFVSDGVKH